MALKESVDCSLNDKYNILEVKFVVEGFKRTEMNPEFPSQRYYEKAAAIAAKAGYKTLARKHSDVMQDGHNQIYVVTSYYKK